MARGAVEVMLKRGESEDRGRWADGPEISSSFESFYREQYPPVVRLALSVLGRPDAAEDVAQEVFIAAHRRFRGDVERAPGWVRVAAVHTALNVIRGDRRRERRHSLAAEPDVVGGPEDLVLARETRAELRRALLRLPTRPATVLVLRHGGMSYADIAAALGVKVGQVGTLLRRAEAALRKEMDKETAPRGRREPPTSCEAPPKGREE